MKLAPRLAIALAILPLISCSDGDRDGANDPVPLRECPEADYTTCDTRDQVCQQRLLSLAACVFGSTQMPDVPIRVLTEDELRGELEREQAEIPAERTEENTAFESVLIDLGMAVAGDLSATRSIDQLIEVADGVYRDAKRGIVLIDRGKSKDSVDYDVLLIHELIHALQDAKYELDALLEENGKTSDSALAIRSLVEGQASWYQYRVAAAMLGLDTVYFDFRGVFTDLRQDLVQEAKEDDSAYSRSFSTFPYAFGTHLMYEAWLDERAGFEAALFGAPPRTTTEIINRSLSIEEAPRELHVFREPIAEDGFALVKDDVLGDWLFNLCLVRKGLSTQRWLGDHLWVFEDTTGTKAWLWEIQLENAPSTFADALQQDLPPHVAVESRGQRLFVSAGTRDATFLLDAGRAFLTE